jgi:PAS domain S-box-containing protein
MKLPALIDWYAPERRQMSLLFAGASIVLIALFDYYVEPSIGIGFLYFFPVLVAAGFLSRKQILLLAIVCDLLREFFGPASHNLQQAVPRGIFAWLAFAGVGLFMRELVANRQRTVEHMTQLRNEMDLREHEMQLREDAERQLHALIESSPAAILTVTADGIIELANDAAHTLMGSAAPLAGKTIARFIPDASVIQNRLGATSALRTAVECRGLREDGRFFLGQLWMSRFTTHAGPRIAVIISDASEQLRDREEIGLQQSLSNSRILVSAVSHEIRNLSSAVAIAHTNLARVPALEHNTDFESLGMLIDGLRRLTSAELMPVTRAAQEGLLLKTIFDDLRIVLQTAAEEAGTRLEWVLTEDLPLVRADRQGLFQVFLNLSHNSFRAMQEANDRVLTISAQTGGNTVTIRFRDTGLGVSHPEQLFKMFRSNSNSSGIGLYISRAILRSYGGDLRYEATESGASFAIELLRSKGSSH